jgi:hypothetical protein
VYAHNGGSKILCFFTISMYHKCVKIASEWGENFHFFAHFHNFLLKTQKNNENFSQFFLSHVFACEKISPFFTCAFLLGVV